LYSIFIMANIVLLEDFRREGSYYLLSRYLEQSRLHKAAELVDSMSGQDVHRVLFQSERKQNWDVLEFVGTNPDVTQNLEEEFVDFLVTRLASEGQFGLMKTLLENVTFNQKISPDVRKFLMNQAATFVFPQEDQGPSTEPDLKNRSHLRLV